MLSGRRFEGSNCVRFTVWTVSFRCFRFSPLSRVRSSVSWMEQGMMMASFPKCATRRNLYPGELHLQAVHVLRQFFCGKFTVAHHCREHKLLLFCLIDILVVIYLVSSFCDRMASVGEVHFAVHSSGKRPILQFLFRPSVSGSALVNPAPLFGGHGQDVVADAF